MYETLKRGGLFAAVLGGLGVIAAGCLDRPVTTFLPGAKINFTTTVNTKAVDKLDILFMIDNSASMGDKQALLALAVPDMINRLVTPNCVDVATGTMILGVSQNGMCATGKIEFPPVHDMHLGIVTSSLGSRGGDQCPDNTQNPVNTALSAHDNDNGELISRGGVAGDPTIEGTVADAAGDSNFLAWFPSVPANMVTGVVQPKMPITMVGPGTASAAGNGDGTLIGDFAEMIEGVHEHGCGFEAQNEAWYRFLVQPDPFQTISVQNSLSTTSGIDNTIIAQRAAFLRPDSLVAVIVVTDENEEVANPNAVFRQSWAFENTTFPGSTNPQATAPEGTTDCQQAVDPNNVLTTGPNNPNCTSCGYTSTQKAGNFASRCPNNGATGTGGYLDPVNDFPNVRFFHQKFRFGVDAGYPTTRYTRGLTEKQVPDQSHETNNNGVYVGDQAQYANCVNPLFAKDLPTSVDPTKEASWCNLTPGSRTADLVFYAAIAGVPHQLLQATPGETDSSGNIECKMGTNPADCPQKTELSDADWLKITGKDPQHYDFTGADFHMVDSESPRIKPWLPDGQTMPSNFSSCPPPTGAPTTASDTCDPINGREWATNSQDLQFACIFPLVDSTGAPTTKDCTQAKYMGACDCAQMSYTANTQLCQIANGAYTTTQINGKAYPSIREMVIAHSMGTQGIVSSLCPIHPSPVGGATDPLFGYRPAVTAIVDRLKNALNNTCLPQKLTPDPTCGNVPCLVIATPVGGTPGMPGTCANPGSACDPKKGLIAPSPDNPASPPEYSQSVATSFCTALHEQWVASGDTNSMDDPDLQPACAIHQLIQKGNANCSITPAPNDFSADSCQASTDPGWCYVTGTAAGTCPQAILFTQTEPPQGWTASLQCIQDFSLLDGGGGD